MHDVSDLELAAADLALSMTATEVASAAEARAMIDRAERRALAARSTAATPVPTTSVAPPQPPAADSTPPENTNSVRLFQRAHQKMVMLQRIEDQMQQLLHQRRSIQDELRGIQVQINEEFDRLIRAAAEASASVPRNARLLVDVVDIGDEGGRKVPRQTPRGSASVTVAAG
jgi:hypothetical protein